jgi:hypothetical protein
LKIALQYIVSYQELILRICSGQKGKSKPVIVTDKNMEVVKASDYIEYACTYKYAGRASDYIEYAGRESQ